MIGRLEGRLHRVDPGTVLINVGGVGYLVSTTLRAFQALAGREDAALWIHTQVRDDAIVLFGFPDREELEAFSKLIAVAGVGPRTALAVLSTLTADELAERRRFRGSRPSSTHPRGWPEDRRADSPRTEGPIGCRLARCWRPARGCGVGACQSRLLAARRPPFGGCRVVRCLWRGPRRIASSRAAEAHSLKRHPRDHRSSQMDTRSAHPY